MANQWRISYERNKILGSGGFGTVFLGTLLTEKGIVEHVAVKRIQKTYNDVSSQNLSTDDPEAREFIHQLKLGKHPNVVQLLHWEDQGEDFRCFALELCQFSLDKVYGDQEKYQRFLPGQLEFMVQLSHGLEYIHSKNLIHRDIKPHNVLISKSPDGNPLVKWGDFGLLKEISRGQCILSGHKGTDWYWAPEIWKMWKNNNDRLNKSNDDKKVMTIMSDIFSSGCVFFEFCTHGTHPFGDDEIQIKTNLSIEPSNPYNLNDFKLKENHFAIKMIKRMLENDPKVRPNLREIILSLLTLQKLVNLKQKCKHEEENQEMKDIEKKFQTALLIPNQTDENGGNILTDFDIAQQELEKMKIELHYLCSRANPTEEQIRKIAETSAKDSVGLVNMLDDNGFSPLLLMCRNNRTGNLIGHIKALLTTFEREDGDINEDMKVDVNYQDRNRFNALHYICSHYQGDDFLEILQLLIQYGIDVNRTEKELDNNALQLFFHDNKRSAGVLKIVQAFIQNGINLKHTSIAGWTPLHHLCKYYTHSNLVEMANLLVDSGVDVNAKTSYGWTALHSLCEQYTHNNLIEVAKLLMDNGVDVTAKTSNKSTALHILCRHYTHNNLIEVAKLLVDNGVDVAAKKPDDWTALHFLCQNYPHNNLIEVAKLLVDSGVDVNAKTSDGCTALHFLCRHYTHNNLIEVAKLLVDSGVDATAKTCDGWTALHFLCQNYTHNNMIEVVKLLVDSGVDVNAKTSIINVNANESKGWTALNFLCRHYTHNNLIEVAKLLVDNGADVNAKTSTGWTALHLLCRYYPHNNLNDSIQLLIDSGIDIHVQTTAGHSASDMLQKFSSYNHENKSEVLELLKNGNDQRNT